MRLAGSPATTAAPIACSAVIVACKNPPGGGTTGTPTVDGDRVFHLSRQGDFFCLELATGKVVYQRPLASELGVEVPEWGFASSPLVEGRLVILNLGSHGTALEKTTGKVAWQNGKGPAAYATRELIKPKFAMPMHYGSNPLAKGTAAEYVQAMSGSATKIFTPEPGQKIDF